MVITDKIVVRDTRLTESFSSRSNITLNIVVLAATGAEAAIVILTSMAEGTPEKHIRASAKEGTRISLINATR